MAAKKSAKKSTNVQKIVNTAKTVNSKVQETAEVIVKDVTNNAKELQHVATSGFEKIQMKKSVSKIKATTKVVNEQITDTAKEVYTDIVNKGKAWSDARVEAVRKRIDAIDVNVNLDTIKSTAKDINSFTLETADEFVEGVMNNGEKIQTITAKTIEGGLKLAERQQEIVFGTLETVKAQLMDSRDRIKAIFSKN